MLAQALSVGVPLQQSSTQAKRRAVLAGDPTSKATQTAWRLWIRLLRRKFDNLSQFEAATRIILEQFEGKDPLAEQWGGGLAVSAQARVRWLADLRA